MNDNEKCHSCTILPASVKCRECDVIFCVNCKTGHLRLPMCALHTMDLIRSMNTLSLQDVQKLFDGCQQECSRNLSDWVAYSSSLDSQQNAVLRQLTQSESELIQAVKDRYEIVRGEATKAISTENQKCLDMIRTLEAKSSDIDKLDNSVKENVALAGTGSKTQDLLNSAQENNKQLKQRIAALPKAPRQPISIKCDIGRALEALGSISITVNNQIVANSHGQSHPSAPVQEISSSIGASGTGSSFSLPYPTHDGFGQMINTAPIILSSSKHTENRTVQAGVEPCPPSYEQATASSGVMGFIAGTVPECGGKNKSISYLDLRNSDFACTRKNAELEKEASKIALVNNELWLVKENAKFDVLNPVTLQFNRVICPGVNHKAYQCKGVVQTANGDIIMAGLAGLFKISCYGDILHTFTTEARFIDVTVDAANRNVIYAMTDTKPYHFIMVFTVDRCIDRWQPMAVLEMKGMKSLFPKIVVHQQTIYVTKNQFIASNHLYSGYCDINGRTKEIVFQAIKKDVFKDNPRLCGIDPDGNVFIGDWGDSQLFRVLTPDNALHNLSVEKNAQYVQDGIVLNDKCFVVISTTYPSKVYGLEGRPRAAPLPYS